MYNSEYDDDETANNHIRVCDRDINNAKFCIFITTKRLLNLVSRATKIHADATHKLLWQGLPVHIVGTTDLDHHFHPFSVATCSNEKTKDFKFICEGLIKGVEMINEEQFNLVVLVLDCSNAFKNAFETASRKNLTVVCWAHMRCNVVRQNSVIRSFRRSNNLYR